MDLILVNGTVWTGDASLPYTEVLGIAGGVIQAVGSETDILARRNRHTEIIDLAGRFVLPGFIDNHTHFITGGSYLRQIDLRQAKSRSDFQNSIAQKAAQLPRGSWLTGGNWDHQLWPGAPLPSKEWVDPQTPHVPVFVTRLDLHMGLANSLALCLAGINKETPDPPGGTIVRDPATGEPTGILKDTAMDLIRRVIPPSTRKERDAALEAALCHFSRQGITSVQDITGWDDWDTLKRFHTGGKLSVRVYARTPVTDWERQLQYITSNGKGDAWLKLGGVKAFVDGSLGSSTAYFFEPYQNEPSNYGLLFEQMVPDGIMTERLTAVDKAGLPISVHAIGDRANHILLNIMEEIIARNGPKDRRLRIEHAQHLTPADIRRMAKLRILASVQPYHLIDDGRWAETKLGTERCQMAFPFRSLLDAGVSVTFGSDWPVAPCSPLLGIYAAVTRRPIDGSRPEGWVPAQKVGVEAAIRAYTGTSAYAEFAETQKGMLTPGKLADMVVLSQNLLSIPPAEIPGTEVVYTIAGGRITYQNY
ncbi:metal-dependent hydrolase [Lucifera butyrica]|uniref:Metal-dependent hydrolase n=1 Tax=Lucifera butyrica TaxID=1351585 RepID=A0A498RC16_9FIRM|nr:amidohydrolase [Lucifera butyrica]VBB06688.1 metal-dependent hydrolase [Lucifera butyrica]